MFRSASPSRREKWHECHVYTPQLFIGPGRSSQQFQVFVILMLSGTDVNDRYRCRTLQLSRKDRHNLSISFSQENSRTLTMIVYIPWIVFHSRTTNLKIVGDQNGASWCFQGRTIRIIQGCPRRHAYWHLFAPLINWGSFLQSRVRFICSHNSND